MSPASWPTGGGRRLVAVWAAGLAAAVVAGQVTAGRASVDDQIPWVTVAVLAAVVTGAANVGWLAAARRATGRRSRGLLTAFAADAGPGAEMVRTGPPAGGDLVAVPGLSLVHRGGCPLIAGRRTQPAAGGEPCGWCRP